jgi:hypothetical protein
MLGRLEIGRALVRRPAAIREPGLGRDQWLRHALHSAFPGFGLKPTRRYLLRLFPASRKDIVGLAVFIGNAMRHSSGLGGKRDVAAICEHLEEALFSSFPERPLGPCLLHRGHAECGGLRALWGLFSRIGVCACAYMSTNTLQADESDGMLRLRRSQGRHGGDVTGTERR